MGEAKRRGTKDERVAQALAAAHARREADFEAAKARLRAEREAKEADATRLAARDGRSVVVRGGTSRVRNSALVLAALAAVLGSTK